MLGQSGLIFYQHGSPHRVYPGIFQYLIPVKYLFYYYVAHSRPPAITFTRQE